MGESCSAASRCGADPVAQQCGWLKDKFGVSWQVIPTELPELVKHSEACQKRVCQKWVRGRYPKSVRTAGYPRNAAISSRRAATSLSNAATRASSSADGSDSLRWIIRSEIAAASIGPQSRCA